jgi:uncharacterized LabA/DUF88 family protein
MDRVCVFFDGSNLYHSMNGECGRTDLDFGRFTDWLVADRRLVRAYYYNARVSGDPERQRAQQRFFDMLGRTPYLETRLGRLEPRGDTFVEKGVDVRIAVDMLSMAYRNIYDAAVLVSCDGDFADAVKAVQDLGKHVEVACFRKAYRLMQTADKVIELSTDSLAEFWLKT